MSSDVKEGNQATPKLASVLAREKLPGFHFYGDLLAQVALKRGQLARAESLV